jgi:ATP-dependent exoDNAse (exonuclease V) beta subunit
VIRENKKRFEKKVTSGDEGRESKVFFNLDHTLDDEAERMASYIRDLIYGKGLKPGDIAVISRVKKFSKIAGALKDAGIRYELIGNTNFYHEPDILFIISWLKVIEDIGDEVSMMYLLKSDRYRIGDRDIFFLKNDGKSGKRIDLIDGIRDCSRNPYLSSTAKKRLVSFMDSLILYIKRSGVLDLKELISLIFEESGLSYELKAGFGRSYKSRMRNVENLIRIAADFKKRSDSSGNADFITYIKDVARTDQDDPDTLEISGNNTVKLMSIHAAKGLEFEAVILPMLWKNHYLGKSGSNSRFSIPSYLRKDSPIWQDKAGFSSASKFKDALKQQKTEEERRIFYVACSRAKSILLLSHSRYESQEDLDAEAKKPREVVPFFKDLVKGSRHIIPLDKEASDYLSSIDENYPDSSLMDRKYFGGRHDKPVKPLAKSTAYNWKKIEGRLTKAISTLSRDKKNIPGDLLKLLGPGINSKEIEKLLAAPAKRLLSASRTPKPGQPRSIFSLTPLLDYLDCPAMYKWRYEYSIPDRQNNAMETGERVHKYIENITRLQYHDGSLDIDSLVNSLSEDFKPYIEAFLESKLADVSPDKPEKMYLERLFYYKAGKNFITGKLDRVDISGQEAEVVDYKTGASSSATLPERYRLQLSTYMAAVSEITGIPLGSTRGSMIFLGDGKILSVNGDEGQIGQDIKILTGVIDRIKKGHFEPVETKGCSKYCPYNNLCK